MHRNPATLRLCLPAFIIMLLALSFSSRADAPDAAKPDGIDWAKARQFWSFKAPVAKDRPVVRDRNWPRQPLDYFVLARLEQQKLTPSGEADKRTLIRRLTFDLTGLPPTPQEIEDFLSDQSSDAWEH